MSTTRSTDARAVLRVSIDTTAARDALRAHGVHVDAHHDHDDAPQGAQDARHDATRDAHALTPTTRDDAHHDAPQGAQDAPHDGAHGGPHGARHDAHAHAMRAPLDVHDAPHDATRDARHDGAHGAPLGVHDAPDAAEAAALAAFERGDLDGALQLLEQHQAAALAAVGDMSAGGILRHRDGARWVFCLPDVDDGGAWRGVRFDARGFAGHEVHRTCADALQALVREGFTTRDDGALDALASTAPFQRGNHVAGLVARVNLGLMTQEQADALLAEYDAQHAQA